MHSILRATQGTDCNYCVVPHERLCAMLGIPAEKAPCLDGLRYRDSPHFLQGKVARLPCALAIPQIFVSGWHLGNDEDLHLALTRGR